jgi:hypothetical protein
MRECTRCFHTKPLEEFKPHKRGRDGRETVCRACRQLRQQEQRKEATRKREAARAALAAPPDQPAAPALVPLLAPDEAAVIAAHFARKGCQNCGPQRITHLNAYQARAWHDAGEVISLPLAGRGPTEIRVALLGAVILCGNCMNAAVMDPALLALDRDQAASAAPSAGPVLAAL